VSLVEVDSVGGFSAYAVSFALVSDELRGHSKPFDPDEGTRQQMI
jgi:hypothetical protein